MVKVVVIDDGVVPGFLPIPPLSSCLEISDGKVQNQVNFPTFITHGTNCASILERLDAPCEIVSLKVLDKRGRGLIGNLVTALRWCVDNGVKIIHASLGTANYYDFSSLSPVLASLCEKNTFIIAACHNTCLPAYPAAFPGVLGVESDVTGTLNRDEYVIRKDDRTSNYIFTVGVNYLYKAPSGHIYKDQHSNSFAAPVITAYVSKLLEKFPNLSLNECIILLKQTASKKIIDLPYYEKVVLHGESETIPVISICGEVTLFKDCLEIIRDSGYRVAAFSDQCEIPLAEYTNVLGDNFWKIIEKIYQPNIIAIHSKKNHTINSDLQIEENMISFNNINFQFSSAAGLKKLIDQILSKWAA